MKIVMTVPIKIEVTGHYLEGTKTTRFTIGDPQDIHDMRVSVGGIDITSHLSAEAFDAIKEDAIEMMFHETPSEDYEFGPSLKKGGS